MELVLLLRAEADSQRIYSRYEERREGSGSFFLSALERALGQLGAFPESGPVLLAPYRRLLIGRFPYGIVYAITGERVVVYAIAPLRQDPERLLAILDDPAS